MNNPLIIENTITGEKIFKSLPVDEEVFFDGGIMITETDSNGIITYANRKFREMTGFSKKELIGSPHSINRHPDMPKGAFRGMWKTITDKKIWSGYIKNMRKDGKFYWVHVFIQPKVDENDNIIGYAATRKVAAPEAVKEIEEIYNELYGDEYIDHKFFMSGEVIYGEEIASRA
jgi:PAS domain S-box-containing protein